ncbi:hypothetical protein MMC11_001439 [Xylographa trunciseda]|nr:hypothetical protein [Xylographa trunciseda]
MLLFQSFIALIPLLTPILAIPSSASSPDTLFKRDDCHGSAMCHKGGTSNAAGALNLYHVNNGSTYTGYTSYTHAHYTAIYYCPKGLYPHNITGSAIFAAGQTISASKKCTCGTHWMPDSKGLLKCRITLNYCSHCKTYVNGIKIAQDGSLAPVMTVDGMAATLTASLASAASSHHSLPTLPRTMPMPGREVGSMF